MANIKAVAEVAGVSASTVSRVLNGTGYVNGATREKVLAAVRRMNYHPNALAKSLKEGRSNTLCITVPSIQNPIFSEITRGAEDEARENGFTVLLCDIDDAEEEERACLEKMKNRWVDGFIVCSRCGRGEHLRALRAQGFPLVLANRYNEEDEGVLDTVAVDNYRSSRAAVETLIAAGYRRIAIANGPGFLYLYRERLRAYRDALAAAGLPLDPALEMHQLETEGVEVFDGMTRALMALPEPPDAIFADSDPKAFIVLHTLHEIGAAVPEQVALLGFDNVGMSAFVQPPLSVVAQPLYEIGVAAARSVLRQIRYKEEHGLLPPPETQVLETELILRRSTREGGVKT